MQTDVNALAGKRGKPAAKAQVRAQKLWMFSRKTTVSNAKIMSYFNSFSVPSHKFFKDQWRAEMTRDI